MARRLAHNNKLKAQDWLRKITHNGALSSLRFDQWGASARLSLHVIGRGSLVSAREGSICYRDHSFPWCGAAWRGGRAERGASAPSTALVCRSVSSCHDSLDSLSSPWKTRPPPGPARCCCLYKASLCSNVAWGASRENNNERLRCTVRCCHRKRAPVIQSPRCPAVSLIYCSLQIYLCLRWFFLLFLNHNYYQPLPLK